MKTSTKTTTLEKITKALNQGTSKYWICDGDMIRVVGGHDYDGSDYSVSLEWDGITVCTTGMSQSFLTRKSLVEQMRLWIGVDEE